MVWTVIHDIETWLTYLETNWNSSSAPTPEKFIWNKGGNKVVVRRALKNSLEIKFGVSDFALGDMTGRFDKVKDIEHTLITYSKAEDDSAASMFKHALALTRALAKTNDVSVSSYFQLTGMEELPPSRFFTEYTGFILQTRRGDYHEVA